MLVLLTSELADKVAVLGDSGPEDHTLNPTCDSGDHPQPNDAGTKAMANTVNLGNAAG